MKKIHLLYLLALVATSTLGFGQTTYTWTGAVDGEWTTAGNWDANGIPEDNYPDVADPDSLGLTMPVGSKIVFNAATVPTSGIPKLGGDLTLSRDTPRIELLQGGAIDFVEYAGRDGSIWINPDSADPTMLLVGDGVGGAGEVELSIGSKVANLQLARHNNNIFSFVVNSDGILNFTSASVDYGANAARAAKVTIAGGEVNFSGVIQDMTGNSSAVVDFTAIGGELTASFGGNFANIAAVQASIGVDFIESYGGSLLAVDNLDGTFTVSAIALQNPIKWTGTGGATWDQSTTTNFSTNAAGGTLTEDTFANALAGSTEIVTFADEYEHDTGPTAVTQTTVSIDAAGVSAPVNGIEFTNNSISYDVGTAGTTGITGATSVAISGGGTVTLSGPNTHTSPTTVTGSSTLILSDELALQNSTLNTDIAPEFDQSVGGNAFTLGGLDSSANIALENNAGSPAAILLTVGNNDSTSTYSGILSGAGGLTKVGTGTFSLNGPNGAANSTVVTNTYTGDTIIKEGTLIAGPGNGDIGFSAATQVYIGDTSGAADATLQFDQSSSTLYPDTINYTVRSGNTGTMSIRGSGFPQLMGTLTLGSTGSDGKGVTMSMVGSNNWNLRFQGVIQDPSGMTPGTGGTITINSAAGRFVSFEAANTYSGDTVVESGNFRTINGGSLSFYPTTNTNTNQLKGAAPSTGVVTLDGPITIDLSSADTTVGNTWQLVNETDLGSVTYGANFAVNSKNLGAFTEVSTGVWSLTDGAADWIFEESTGVLVRGAPTSYWTGDTNGTWDADSTANFSDNAPAAALNSVTFDVATAINSSVTFADTYFDSGAPIDVTEDNVTIAAGGVSTGTVVFENTTGNLNSVSYNIDGADANGITGSTAVTISGGGTVTLSSPNTHSGITTVTSGSLILADELALQNSTLNTDTTSVFDESVGGNAFTLGGLAGTGGVALENNAGSPASIQLTVGNNDSNTAYSGILSGAGSLIKVGTGSSTLSGANTFSGGTTVNDGLLIVGDDGALGSGVVELAGGTLTNVGSRSIANAINITGTSRIESANSANFALSGLVTGAGTLNLGGNASGNSTVVIADDLLGFSGTVNYTNASNGNNVNINGALDTTAKFTISQGTGTGRYLRFAQDSTIGELSGADGAFIINTGKTLTINQSTDTSFGGVIGIGSAAGGITKDGTGSLTLTGANVFTGTATVSAGTLSAENNSALGNTTSVVVDGGYLDVRGLSAGTLTLGTDADLVLSSGTIGLDLGTNVDQIVGNGAGSQFDITSGTLELFLNPGFDYNNTYAVLSGFGGTNSVAGLSITGYDTGTYTATLGTDGVLSFALSGSPFDTWATGSETFDGDGNGDGVLDGLAFLLGAADPSTDANALLPTVSEDGSGNLVLTFSMLNAANRGTASLATQHSSDLGATDAWDAAGNEETVPETTSTVGVVSFSITPNGTLNDVIATIPDTEGAAGKLFGRLLGTEAP
ncbi:MAG: beta strand repeat-containing protein [Opitutaceae bacterium]